MHGQKLVVYQLKYFQNGWNVIQATFYGNFS